MTEEVSQHLAGVNGVVEILLKHATNDELSNEVKQNSAICLAKLATADKRYSIMISFPGNRVGPSHDSEDVHCKLNCFLKTF